MSTLASANVTDVNLVLKERTHMRLCINILIFTHNLGNWLICDSYDITVGHMTSPVGPTGLFCGSKFGFRTSDISVVTTVFFARVF